MSLAVRGLSIPRSSSYCTFVWMGLDTYSARADKLRGRVDS